MHKGNEIYIPAHHKLKKTRWNDSEVCVGACKIFIKKRLQIGLPSQDPTCSLSLANAVYSKK